MVPLLKGRLTWLTKKTSILLKSARVEGNSSLKINKRIATETILATTKFLKVTFSVFLKKYSMPIAGMVNNPIKCTPKESPMTKAMRSNQRSPRGVFISFSQRIAIQNSAERMQVAIAYTSASTALNQKLSEKQKAKAPTAALPK